MLCCLYLIVNFQVKTQVPLWGKYHKRKVIIRLQQVSSIRVTVVVTKIIFKLFLSVLAINKEKYKFSYYNLYMHYYFLINLSVKVANGYIYIWASNMPNDSPIQLELLKDQIRGDAGWSRRGPTLKVQSTSYTWLILIFLFWKININNLTFQSFSMNNFNFELFFDKLTFILSLLSS